MTKSFTSILDQSRGTDSDPAHVNHGQLLYMMHELSRLISVHFDAAMAAHALTRAQWWALMHISLNEGESQSELARIMQMGRAGAGKLFERMEAKGWIERRPDPNDSRVLRVFLLDGVLPVFEAMRSEGRKQFAALLAGIDAEEEEVLLAGLRKIKANAERAIAARGEAEN